VTVGAPATVVLLNGVGSVGKSSIARALQRIAGRPFLHLQMDGFLDMLPEACLGSPEGMVFEPLTEDGHPSVAIHTGPVVDRALAGMRHAVAAMADQGNDLIVDEVATAVEMADYRRLLAGHRLHTVGVLAPLAILEERERLRGDREIGLARWQFPRLHRGIAYDLEIDAAEATAEDCAQRIKRAFDL